MSGRPCTYSTDRDYVDVVVVDDDLDVRESIADVLRSVGYSVVEAEDGRVAIQVLGAVRPGVLLLDMRMPNVDGVGVLDALEEHENVILMSGHPFDHFDIDETEYWCMRKPIQPRRLIEAIDHTLTEQGRSRISTEERPLDRLAVVRVAYQRFNEKDFEGTLAFFHDDAELEDSLQPGSFVQGKQAILQLWQERFAGETTLTISPGEMFESDDTVVAVVHYQMDGRDEAHLGVPVVFLHRVRFRADRIARVETRTFDGIPQELMGLYRRPSMNPERT